MRKSIVSVALFFTVLFVALGAGTRVSGQSREAHAWVEEGDRALSLGDRSRAILDFERARFFAPRADFVRGALQATTVRDIEPIVPRTFRLLSSHEWCVLAIVCGLVVALGGATLLAGYRRRAVGLSTTLALGTLVVSLAGVGFAGASSPAIVLPADAQVLVAPYATAAVAGSVPAGSMVLTGSTYGDFVHLEPDSDRGAGGWIRRSSVEDIAARGVTGT